MNVSLARRIAPDIKSVASAFLSAVLLIFAFPDFEIWPLAWVGLIPLMLAVEREKRSFLRSFTTGWVFGLFFFFGTTWWLTFAPITYAAFSPILAYGLMAAVSAIVAVFPAVFAGLLGFTLNRLGWKAMLAAPVFWVMSEILRYLITGNNWNAIAYSQAFGGAGLGLARLGGIYLVGFLVVAIQSLFVAVRLRTNESLAESKRNGRRVSNLTAIAIGAGSFLIVAAAVTLPALLQNPKPSDPFSANENSTFVAAVQPNVPMSGLNFEKWISLRARHVAIAESAFSENAEKFSAADAVDDVAKSSKTLLDERFAGRPKVVIFPESPMNFSFDDDPEFRAFIGAFASANNASVLFNAAEPDATNGKYFNSAVMIDERGREIAQYDKIDLLPFGEAVPRPLQSIIPAFVGSFSYGREFDLLPFGDVKAGVMICFESHFGEHSRQYAAAGADVLVEITNDGYLGPTPVLRQHLANAVFRAIETNRPVVRVTNVGLTAFIDENGTVIDIAPSYIEASRLWSINKSDGSKTFYVRFGDWAAWLCVGLSILLIIWARSRPNADYRSRLTESS